MSRALLRIQFFSTLCGHDRPVERERPFRASREWAVPPKRRRCVFNDQAVNPGRLLLSDQIGDRSAKGVPYKGDAVEAELVKHAEDVVSHGLEGLVAWSVTLSVAAEVNGNNAEGQLELGPDGVPSGTLFAERVQQHQRGESPAPLI